MSDTSLDLDVRIGGIKQTITALRNLAPDVKREMDREIRQVMGTIKAGAESRYPEGSWEIKLNRRRLFGSVEATAGGERADTWRESGPGVKAAVFEFAGKYQPGRTPQAKAMIDSLNARYGSPGRFLWDSWDANKTRALAQIRDAVLRAERELQTRLDSAGDL
jgi:hypothetical protein